MPVVVTLAVKLPVEVSTVMLPLPLAVLLLVGTACEPFSDVLMEILPAVEVEEAGGDGMAGRPVPDVLDVDLLDTSADVTPGLPPPPPQDANKATTMVAVARVAIAARSRRCITLPHRKIYLLPVSIFLSMERRTQILSPYMQKRI